MENELSLASNLIEAMTQSRHSVLKEANEELIGMHWEIGKFLSREAKQNSYDDAHLDAISEEIQKVFPSMKGLTRRTLDRMKLFYETYENDEIAKALLRQVSWSSHLAILSAAKTQEQRQFYLMLCVREKYSARELSRLIDSAYYERCMLSKEKPLPEPSEGLKEDPFSDSYVTEFLNLPAIFGKSSPKNELIHQMKDYILEVDKDFTFVEDECRVQVGGEDYYIDLLLFHRGLRCLVAFELKLGKFNPEYISEMNFYLEALDRQKKKENENPSVGVILCASKDDEAVEYTLSRSLLPLMVSEYRLKLPAKKTLQQRLRELLALPLFNEKR